MTPIQTSLAIECFMNILGAVTFLVWPEWCLSYAVSTPMVPASTIVLWQIYAVLVLELTFGLMLCIPNVPGAKAKRTVLFQILGNGEVGLIVFLLYYAIHAERSGFTHTTLLCSAASLVPLAGWKFWVLWGAPEMLDDGSNGKSKGP